MASYSVRTVHTVDSHTEGNPTRAIVGGVPVPPAATLQEKREWLKSKDDGLRPMIFRSNKNSHFGRASRVTD